MTEQRVTYLYELMDSAYDAKEIKEFSQLHGHVPIININTRNNTKLRDELNMEANAPKMIRMTTLSMFVTMSELRQNGPTVD